MLNPKKQLILYLFCYLAICNIQAIPIEINNNTNLNSRINVNDKINACQATKIVTNNYEPGIFNSTNNLLRHVGQNYKLKDKIVIIRGTVVDKNCVPVLDAKVYLWQVDANGKYPYIPLKSAIDQSLISNNLESTFTGSGMTTTNNNGNFYFMTIYPAAVHNIPPHFNFRVKHMELGSLQTIQIIKNDEILKLPCSNCIHNTEIIIEYVTLVMPSASKIRRHNIHAITKSS
ncbi:dioxygenase family protein [Orientia chuto str. Dubai]|uniref:Dioxygenase family protein n=1 Tax=Orientia chuto str. Dubai TaxID=1359168 RepID=A0A0F3MPH9_9RICK|nr:intradiol ring-cleavage dioxygenase [Candidatus Orientia mediorientalis]KJV57551.1 dioxygenase family protein [Orientia chuto str. Dubai]